MIAFALAPMLALALQTLSPGAASPAGALNGGPIAATTAAQAASVAEQDKVVCRRHAETGSRVGGVRECLTNAQWHERELVNAQNLRESQAKGVRPQP